MNDPVYRKLRTDAGQILVEIWWKIMRQASRKGAAEYAKVIEGTNPALLPKNDAPVQSSGLCYFHLN
jgi:hypothetical protein